MANENITRMPLDTGDSKFSDGGILSVAPTTQQGAMLVAQRHAALYEAAYRKKLFFAANQATQAVSVALATTYTGLCVSNPAGNSWDLVLHKVTACISASAAALSVLGLLGGYVAAGVVTHTSALTPISCYLDESNSATAKADDEATIVGTPRVIMSFGQVDDDAAIGFPGVQVVDIDGAIIIPPGAYVAIYALTAVTGFFSMIWEEVSR